MPIGEKIVALRRKKDITQTELAKQINISRSVMNRIELGSRAIRDDELRAIAIALEVSTDYLLGNDTLNNKIDTQPEQVLSKDEWDLIHKYRQLSAKAKKKIKANVDIELDDYTESENESRNA